MPNCATSFKITRMRTKNTGGITKPRVWCCLCRFHCLTPPGQDNQILAGKCHHELSTDRLGRWSLTTLIHIEEPSVETLKRVIMNKEKEWLNSGSEEEDGARREMVWSNGWELILHALSVTSRSLLIIKRGKVRVECKVKVSVWAKQSSCCGDLNVLT